jgi:hypothetical protein
MRRCEDACVQIKKIVLRQRKITHIAISSKIGTQCIKEELGIRAQPTKMAFERQ